jgi:plasmid maintenance system killer protein
VDILFQTSKLVKEFNTEQLLVRRHGPRRAQLIQRRLIQLRAANVLEDLRKLPQVRCHELTGNRAGQLSLDLDHPYRLICEPANDPIPQKPDGGLDWTRVTTVVVLGVEDTHE